MRTLLLLTLIVAGPLGCEWFTKSPTPSRPIIYFLEALQDRQPFGSLILLDCKTDFTTDPEVVLDFDVCNGSTAGTFPLTLVRRSKDPEIIVTYPNGDSVKSGDSKPVRVWFAGTPREGDYILHIDGVTTRSARVSETISFTFRIRNCSTSTLPPGTCPVGDILFEFTPNQLSSPISGIRSFADRNGGESCLAVNWSFQADQQNVTVSPIREEVAYTADGSLWIVSIKDPVDVNHNQTEHTPPDARKLDGDFGDLAWSPDGQWIACTDTELTSGVTSIRILNAEDLRANVAVPREIGIQGLGSDPTWSPDLDRQTAGYQGKIYFVGTYNELRSADLTDNALGQTLDVSAAVSVQTFPDDFLAPACSPDGTKIAFVSYELVGGLPKKRLRILDVDDPAGHRLLGTRNSLQDEDDEPAWWDNSTIVFSRFVFTGPNPGQGRFSLFEVTTQGGGREIFGPLGQPLDGGATRPAIVPAALR